MDPFEQHVFEAIYKRRSVRKFQRRPVEQEKVDKLLRAAMAAPSACNLQPWEFIVVRGKEQMDALQSAVEQGASNPSMAVIACGNTKNIPWGDATFTIDVAAAVENLMIAAVPLGLGTLWIGSHDRQAIRAAFHIPPDIHVMSVVYVGYPDEDLPSGTRYNAEAVFQDAYDPDRPRALRTLDMLGDRSVQKP